VRQFRNRLTAETIFIRGLEAPATGLGNMRWRFGLLFGVRLALRLIEFVASDRAACAAALLAKQRGHGPPYNRFCDVKYNDVGRMATLRETMLAGS